MLRGEKWCKFWAIYVDGAGIAQLIEALYFTTKLHTSSICVRVQPWTSSSSSYPF